MRLIQITGVLSLLLFFSNLYSVSAMTDGLDTVRKPSVFKPAAEGKHAEELPSTDSDLSSARSSESHTSGAAAAKPKGYNADEIIDEIKTTSKRSYSKDRLFVGKKVFQFIKENNSPMIEKFRQAIDNFTIPDETEVSLMWSCSAEYYAASGNIRIQISDPK